MSENNAKLTAQQRLYFSGQTVTLEEKVDGANLGFAIAQDGTITAQNRAHFVNDASHPQFRSLSTVWFQER